MVAGDAAEAVAERLAARGVDALLSAVRLPDAGAAARVAALRLAGRLPPLAARPLYVEPPAVRQPLRAGDAGVIPTREAAAADAPALAALHAAAFRRPRPGDPTPSR